MSTFEPHSGVDINMGLAPTSKEKNMTFIEGDDAGVFEVPTSHDSTRSLRRTDDMDLNSFFSRPERIYSFTWSVGTEPYIAFNPWNAYFNNSRVINRISNYNLLQAKLHIKIVINGNGFLYGRLLAAYLPLDTWDQMSDIGPEPNDAIQCSQLPHVYIDPTTSKGGEIVCPFLYHRDYLSITDASWSEMGTLIIRTLNQLKHANGADEVITVAVFAWAEDVVLSGLTSIDPTTMIPQSGQEVDQANLKGMISGPATAISNMAGKLTGIPTIGPYAMATQKVGQGVAAVAKAFGMSRPTHTAVPVSNRLKAVSSLACTTVPDNVEKLTVDDKQELSIDPSIMGLGSQDAMDITSISTRESYLTTFGWNIGTGVDGLLWNCKVSPSAWACTGLPNANGTAYHFPACTAAVQPFTYWTGSIKYRFQIVCSNFHKGRIRIVHDPNWSISANQFNVQYSHIVDLAETQDFTIQINPAQATTLMKYHNPAIYDPDDVYKSTAFTAVESEQGVPLQNGMLSVYVLNRLTVPNSTINNDIQINVFISTGDDFEVFVPFDGFANFTFFDPTFEAQSGYEVDGQETTNPSAPEQTDVKELGPDPSNQNNINVVYTGESIKSFRQMLKRYNIHTCFGSAGYPDEPTVTRLTAPWYPYYRGKQVEGVNNTLEGYEYNYCNTILLHWVSTMFSAMRGSIRYKLVPRWSQNGDKPLSITGYVLRYSDEFGNDEYEITTTPSGIIGSRSQQAWLSVFQNVTFNVPTCHGGATYFNSAVNPCVEYEVPFYSPFRFAPGKHRVWTGIDTYLVGGWRAILYSNTPFIMDVLVAAGEDFQLGMFTGMPRMYREGPPPLPSDDS
jgi:hypothetical protein